MPLQITCAMCGGQVEPDDLALRRELVICPYCSTLNRITQIGTKKSAESIQDRQIPEEVKIERNGKGQSLFYVKGQRYFPPKTVLMWFSLICVVMGICLVVYLFPNGIQSLDTLPPLDAIGFIFTLACVFGVPPLFIAFLFGLSILGQLKSHMPPVKLEGDILFPSDNVAYWGKIFPTPVKEIRQIYTVARRNPNHSINFDKSTQLSRNSNFYRDSFSVYALTLDGKRIPLIDHIFDEEIALYIEELLEVETGIFNLPVYGDPNLPRDIKTKTPSESLKKPELVNLNCKSCGAPLSFHYDTPQKGYLVCQYCHVLTLLYTPENKPVLGLSELNSPTSQFKLEKRGDLLKIHPRNPKSRNQILLLSKTHFGLRTFKGRGASFAFSEITTIYTKENEEIQAIPSAFTLKFAKNDEGVGDEMAYSSNLDKVIKRIRGELFYEIVAKSITGRDITLLDKIRNPLEALTLTEFLLKLHKRGGQKQNLST